MSQDPVKPDAAQHRRQPRGARRWPRPGHDSWPTGNLIRRSLEDHTSNQPVHGSWSTSGAATWLGDHGGERLSVPEILSSVCDRLTADGVPLLRVHIVQEDVHPQIDATATTWVRGEGVAVSDFEYTQNGDSEEFLASPIKVVLDGTPALRRRLCDPDCPHDFPVLDELREQGVTDYVAAALIFTDGAFRFTSWTTDAPGGFSPEHIALIDDILPLLALRLELTATRHFMRRLLTTYMGGQAAERVVNGTIRRFDCEAIDAVILYCDLRNFTSHADRLSPHDCIQMLGHYHDAIITPVQYFGGDVVKIIGDGILSVFPIYDTDTQARIDHVACGAHAAVRRAIANLDSLDPDSLPEGVDQLRAGFALHAGTVAFGNVGSPDRLDFTVIGPAVNEAVRVEGLTKELGIPILATSAYRDLECSVTLESVGRHQLRGVRAPVELFRPLPKVLS